MNISQISVFLENRTGQLAEVTHLLAENNINLRAISIAESTDYGILRKIGDDAEKATSVLLSNGHVLSMTPVTVVAVPDQPSGLSQVLNLLAECSIGIEYMYSLFTHQNGNAYMVFRLAEEKKFLEFLAAHGMSPVSKEELGLK